MIILVADDDRLNRITLRSMLEEILPQDDTVLEAWNGKEMIAVCKEKMPDIVFTDIKMPYVNGIDAIEECKKYNQHSVFVVVSGYSDFEVAQRALQLKVEDYLLKPVNEQKLRKVVEKIQNQLAEEKELLNSNFKLELFHALNHFQVSGEKTEYEERSYGENFRYEVIGVKSCCFLKNRKTYVQLQNEIIQHMETIGKKLLKTGSCYSHVYSDEGNVFFIFCTNPKGRREIHSAVKNLANNIGKPDTMLHFTCFSRETIREVYAEFKRSDACQGIVMNYPNRAFIDLDKVSVSEDTKRILSQVSRIMEAWEGGDVVAYKENVYKLAHQYQEATPELHMEMVSQYCSNMMKVQIRGENLKVFCQSLLEDFALVFADTKGEADVVELVKAYIEKNYANDIGVAHVAEVFDITPNYLSSIFRQKVGCKFTEYLTNVRVEHAKQFLIQNKTASISDVAVQSGYNRAGYFTMVFQKVTGLKPSDYRKKYMRP